MNFFIFKECKQNAETNDILIREKTNVSASCKTQYILAISIIRVDYWPKSILFIIIGTLMKKKIIFPAVCDNRSYC